MYLAGSRDSDVTPRAVRID